MIESTRQAGFASRATHVTLFEDRAEVVRRAEVQLAVGAGWVALEGASSLIDERSVQAKLVEGEAKVLAVRVQRTLDPGPRDAEVARLEGEVEAQRGEVERLEVEIADLEAELQRLHSVLGSWGRGVACAGVELAEEEGRARWRAAYEAVDARLEAGAARRVVLGGELRRARVRLQRTRRDLGAAQSETPPQATQVEVQLDAPAAGAAVLEVVYRVPAAVWRPEHLATLRRDSPEATDGEVELVTYAVAWQRTGEDWSDVTVAFSTARPGRAANPPELEEDRLQTTAKSHYEQKVVEVEVRDQEVAVTGVDRGGGQAAMPGVDDGGEPLRYEPEERVTLRSDGRPFRVEVQRHTLSAELTWWVVPERSPAPHLRATLTHRGTEPLLAGPVRLARSVGLEGVAEAEFVGRARQDFVAPGAAFELGFGGDDSLRVRRKVSDERSTTSVKGTQILERTVRLDLSNLSTDGCAVTLRERYPVSEVDAVWIQLDQAEGWDRDEADGFLTRAVELAPSATETIELKYTVKATSKVQLHRLV